MKTDYSFKLVAAIIFAGVVVALVSPAPAPNLTEGAQPEAAHAAPMAE